MLAVVSPFLAEVLFGATRISFIFALIPQIAVWGGGTVLIREAVRRAGGGWVSLLLLGLALAVAEECVIQQTSFAPLVGAVEPYGRAWGVNWVYLLWALGYESVWVVVLPVQLTELVFVKRRAERWLSAVGLLLVGSSFTLGSLVAWYSWTQVARTSVFHLPAYQPPLVHVLLALGAIALLAIAAFSPAGLPRTSRAESARGAPPAWAMGLLAFASGFPWCILLLMAYGLAPGVSPLIPTIGGIAWAGVVLICVRRWAVRTNWHDLQRFAVVTGGTVACIAAGCVLFAVGGALTIDWVGKLVLNGLAVLALFGLGMNVSSARPSA
jgi:hypothetical protein